MERIKFTNTKITGGFWAKKQELVKNTTVMAVYDRFKETGRFDAFKCEWVDGKENNPEYPNIYWDSDVAKWIEGVSYFLQNEKNAELEQIIDEVIDNIEKNSDENGYYNSHFLVTEQNERFRLRRAHELYCAGHLMEAAVAYYEATGKDKLLKAMCKYADYIEKVFVIDKSAAFKTPGHPEIELALVRLYEATGEKKYLELSKYFIDEHGKTPDLETHYPDASPFSNQDDCLIKDRTTADGHCVRALYLFCGAADIAKYYNNEELFNACKRVFDNIVNKRMYITGGVGSTHIGEAFTVDYDLPNRTAYTETCAAISLAMFAGRMQTMEVKSIYADIIEKVLYNGFLSGMSMDGKAFFYENPLEIDPYLNNVDFALKEKRRVAITQRKEVFNCSCCPPNIVRFIPSVADYMYTYDDETLYVHQYMEAETECEGIKIKQTTNYPSGGKIEICCKTDKGYVALRIPGWCKKFNLNCEYELKNGYAYIKAEDAENIVLELDMPVVLVEANRKVHENAGRIAVTRGPVVYCAEGVDNGEDLRSIVIDPQFRFELTKSEFMLPSLRTKAYKIPESKELYRPIGAKYEDTVLRLIPYYAFANRGESEMLVWFLKK